MAALGLVDRKQPSRSASTVGAAAATSSAAALQPVDPDQLVDDAALAATAGAGTSAGAGASAGAATGTGSQLRVANVKAPAVQFPHVYADVERLYETAHQSYKFVWKPTGQRLTFGVEGSVENHGFKLRWIFKGTADDQLYARVEQPVVPFARPDLSSSSSSSSSSASGAGYIVTLRPRAAGKDVLRDLVDLVGTLQIEATELPSSPAARAFALEQQDRAAAHQAELRRKEEQLRQEDAERRARAAAEADAAMRPLNFRAPAAFRDQQFGVRGRVLLGDIVDRDLYRPLAGTGARDAAVAAASSDASSGGATDGSDSGTGTVARAPTTEELNATGKSRFLQCELHEQIVCFVDQIVAFFKPVVSTVTGLGVNDLTPTVQATIYCVNDVQHEFENAFAQVDRVKAARVQVFPIYLIDSVTPARLAIKNYQTDEYLALERPEDFCFIGHLRERPEYGYTLVKCVLQQTESERTDYILNGVLNLMVEKLVDYLMGFRRRRFYGNLAARPDDSSSTAGSAGAATAPASSAAAPASSTTAAPSAAAPASVPAAAASTVAASAAAAAAAALRPPVHARLVAGAPAVAGQGVPPSAAALLAQARASAAQRQQQMAAVAQQQQQQQVAAASVAAVPRAVSRRSQFARSERSVSSSHYDESQV